MNNNLSLIGSEIINGNNNLNNISSFAPVKTEQKIITKSYVITNTPLKEKTIGDYKEKKTIGAKRGNSLDLSKIMYNDGYLLTDAVNSNPGFGLWAIKVGSSNNNINPINNNNNNNVDNSIIRTKIYKTNSDRKLLLKENKNIKNNNRYNLTTRRTNKQLTNNLSTIKNINSNNNVTINTDKSLNNINNDISLNNSNTNNIKINETNHNNNEINESNYQNKKFIEQLTMKCNDLEQKYLNIMTNYKEKEYLCQNSIKIKNEYEKMLQDNIEDAKSIKEEYQKIFLENSKLKSVFKNTKNHLDHLLNVMRTDNNSIKKIREEFENRLKKEENERARLINILNINKKEIELLRKSAYGIEDNKNENGNIISNYNNNSKKRNSIIINIKNSSQKKDFEIENLNDIILELEIKISSLKKKIARTDEENDKLRHILRFKDYKGEIDINNINNLNNLLDFNIKNQRNEMKTIKEQQNIINNWKKNNGFIIKKNKLANSMSLKKINFK